MFIFVMVKSEKVVVHRCFSPSYLIKSDTLWLRSGTLALPAFLFALLVQA